MFHSFHKSHLPSILRIFCLQRGHISFFSSHSSKQVWWQMCLQAVCSMRSSIENCCKQIAHSSFPVSLDYSQSSFKALTLRQLRQLRIYPFKGQIFLQKVRSERQIHRKMSLISIPQLKSTILEKRKTAKMMAIMITPLMSQRTTDSIMVYL